MFALFRRRRKAAQVVPDQVRDPVSSAKYVGGAFCLVFFGSLFLFLELFGKCGCSGDIFGYIMVSIGTFTLIYQCIKDLAADISSDEEDGNEDDDGLSTSTVETEINTAPETGADLFRHVMVSQFLSPENEKVELKDREVVKVVTISAKLPPNVYKVHETINLPSRVVET